MADTKPQETTAAASDPKAQVAADAHDKHEHHKSHHKRHPHHSAHQHAHRHHHHHPHHPTDALKGCVSNTSADHLFHEHLPHWAYDGENGPAKWGTLHESFKLATVGKNQSPIDIEKSILKENPSAGLELHYAMAPSSILNNGHTIQLTWSAGFIVYEGKTFYMMQAHFHTPSEHVLSGIRYPLELHLVHKNAENQLAVLGIFFEEGDASPFIAEFFDHIPEKAAAEGELPKAIGDLDPFPLGIQTSTFFKYDGSLTTPPCSEGVTWLVIPSSLKASSDQIAKIKAAIGKENSRPIQLLNEREVHIHTP